MITRVVKLTFKNEHVDTFIGIVQQHQLQIRNFPGCHELHCYQDISSPNIFFTISKWENDEALNHYRYSDFFKTLWATLKPMFAEKAMAHSVGMLGQPN